MDNYDCFAREYKEGTERFDGEIRQFFYSFLPDLKEKNLLDVGCGSGGDAAFYACAGAEVCGIDLSAEQLIMARERTKGIFVQESMENISFATNQFDIVTSFYALQHAEDVTKALLEMIRVARPGGTILVLVEHPFRNLLEGHVNDGKSDYYAKREVTTYLYDHAIKLKEPAHTMMDYLAPAVLQVARLERLEEKTDFPATEQVIPGLLYPTCMILKYRKTL